MSFLFYFEIAATHSLELYITEKYHDYNENINNFQTERATAAESVVLDHFYLSLYLAKYSFL